MIRLRELFVRHQRGLLSYEGLTVGELRLFVVQRGLSSTTAAKATAATLKARLEQADEDATFNWFTELPPEIRQQVFEQYFASRPGSQKLGISHMPELRYWLSSAVQRAVG